MKRIFAKLVPAAIAGVLAAAPCAAWELDGTHTLTLHGRDGREIPIGTVTFRPDGVRSAFALHLDERPFKDFFVSMKEFKCLEGGDEIQCHVPYPYANPATVTRDDLAWLEHALLFLHKSPNEFGARLWNGLYYRMAVTDDGIVGTAEAVDLNLIGAPPSDLAVPPFGPAERSEIAPGVRWLGRLTIR